MERTYNIGTSSRYGNIIAVSENLTEVTEEVFYKEINRSIKNNHLQRYKKEAKEIKNLKLGVTVGCDFYLIKDIGKRK